MQTDALNYDFSREESRSEPIRVRKRVRVKSRKKYSNNARKQPLTNLKAKNWVTFAALIFLVVAFAAGLFYLAYNHLPEGEPYPEYQQSSTSTTATSTLE
jgi:hypothetical protein